MIPNGVYRVLSARTKRRQLSVAKELHNVLRNPALRVGSLAIAISLALGLALLEGLSQWFPPTPNSTSTSARASARLSMQQLYDRINAGDPQPIRDRINSLRKELPEDELDWNYGNIAHRMLILMGIHALVEENDLAGAKNY